jgi:D-alanyl-lipoteichoic acid acyltransferase DltB (MBOAT superfamily)
MIALYLVHNPFFSIKTLLKLNERQSFLFEVSIAWLNAKCLSLSIDRIRNGSHKSFKLNDMIKCMAYCLYFPAFYTGPIHQYSSFMSDVRKLFSLIHNSIPLLFSQLNKIPLKWTSSHLLVIAKQLIRYAFWTLILEVMLHFVYSSSIQYYPEISDMFDIWTLCGLGFALPLIFFIKYFIIYGSVAAIAMIDGFHLPPPPKCISRIHSCSYLWRTFDRGLHLWLTK